MEIALKLYEFNCENKDKPQIEYGFFKTQFGKILVGATNKGICFLGFADNQEIAVSEIQNSFPKYKIKENENPVFNDVLKIFEKKEEKDLFLPLHLKCTDFQLKVYKSLLKLSKNGLITYKNIANDIGCGSYRAVGTALGKNPVAVLIPCHRVIGTSGKLGGYKWGLEKKQKLIEFEQNCNFLKFNLI